MLPDVVLCSAVVSEAVGFCNDAEFFVELAGSHWFVFELTIIITPLGTPVNMPCASSLAVKLVSSFQTEFIVARV